jgi:GNAT superfamily N-acetyltransferase
MQLLEVGDNPTLQREFLLFPVRLYRDDAHWIRPLDQDVEAIFNPKKNRSFRHGKAIRWVLQDGAGQTIGRVAAFVDFEKAKKEEQPTGGMGLFECTNDQTAANALFDACKTWLQAEGMEAVDGPVNFGERDTFWGLTIKGWEFEPTYKMPWTKPYYPALFEAYGFREYFQQYVYVAHIFDSQVSQSVQEKAQRVYDNPEFTFRHIEKKRLAKYAEDFRTIYNEAWARFPGVNPMTEAQATALVNTMKPIVDENLIWYAYAGERPVAFFIVIPDLNQIVKHLDGQFNWWAKLKLLYLLKVRRVVTRTCGVLFGVVPDYQGRGIESAIALQFRRAALQVPKYPYETMDMNWIGDFNPKMLRFVSQLGSDLNKIFATYRLLFDPTKEFKRHPKVG